MFELDTLQGHHASNYHDDSSHASDDSSSCASSCCSDPLSGHNNNSHHHRRDGNAPRTICLLGTRLSRTDTSSIRQFQRNLYWMTYRNELMVGLRPYCGGGKFVGVGVGGGSGDGGSCGLAFGGPGEGDVTNLIETTSGLKTDAGWGCMLRSAQMMLAQTIRVHFSTRDTVGGLDVSPTSSWRRHGCHDLEEIRIATWFADFPNPDLALEQRMGGHSGLRPKGQSPPQPQHSTTLSDNHHWYSLHQMVAAGLGLGVLPGEWYGPTTACHVLRELNELHCTYHEQKRGATSAMGDDDHEQDKPMFRIHIATEGCIYLDAVSKLMVQNNKKSEQSGSEHEQDYTIITVDDPLRTPTKEDDQEQEWDTALLLLLPLRLGIHSIPTSLYGGTLSKLLQFSQSVGMLGGTPRHALWFYGAEDVDLLPSEDGKEEGVGGWYGLDPHVVQPAPRGELVVLPSVFDDDSINNDTTSSNHTCLDDKRSNRTNKRYHWRAHLNESYLRSLHISPTTSHPNHDKSIPLSKLDPSLALGFYIRNQSDFTAFRESLNALNTLCRRNKLPEVVTVLDKAPNYEVDVSAVMKNMALNNGKCREVNAGLDDDLDGFSIKSDEVGLNEDEDDLDDDEYVLV